MLSVLLPVRDARAWLRRSLASLWRQTLADFEVIAVDDGSSDGSGALLDREAAREPRLRVLHTAERGLPAALNTALDQARAELLARHDADDLSHHERFARQHAWMSSHRGTIVLGSRLRLFPPPALGIGMRRWAAWHNRLLTHQQMTSEMLIDSPLAHGTACIRRGALERAGGWAERGWPEDLDLWLRLLEHGARFDKLPLILYAWRQHPDSATRRDPRYRRERFDELRLAALGAGVLRGAGRVTLIGVGASLERWRAHLAKRVVRLRLHELARPARDHDLQPPLVLVFGSLVARRRW